MDSRNAEFLRITLSVRWEIQRQTCQSFSLLHTSVVCPDFSKPQLLEGKLWFSHANSDA
jgi:hypothetical protein